MITMRTFGKHGRYGNQLLQYAYLRFMARKWNQDLRLPPWAGAYLFGRSELNWLGNPLPDFHETMDDTGQGIIDVSESICDRNFVGYAQYHTRYLAADRTFFRSFFKPTRDVLFRVEGAGDRLADYGGVKIGLHIRRGDYGQDVFHIIPTSWYKEWLGEHYRRFMDPVLFIATEDKSVIDEFSEYSPLDADDLGAKTGGRIPDCDYLQEDIDSGENHLLDFYPDHYLLSKCDVIVGPNSTFSFTAAMLNPRLLEYHRSRLSLRGFELVDPWRDVPIVRERCEDFRNIPGIHMDDYK
jgi:hypothetical protein